MSPALTSIASLLFAAVAGAVVGFAIARAQGRSRPSSLPTPLSKPAPVESVANTGPALTAPLSSRCCTEGSLLCDDVHQPDSAARFEAPAFVIRADVLPSPSQSLAAAVALIAARQFVGSMRLWLSQPSQSPGRQSSLSKSAAPKTRLRSPRASVQPSQSSPVVGAAQAESVATSPSPST